MTFAELAENLVRTIEQAQAEYRNSTGHPHTHLVGGDGKLLASGSSSLEMWLHKQGTDSVVLNFNIPADRSVSINLLSSWLCLFPDVSLTTMYCLYAAPTYVSIRMIQGGKQ